MRKWLLGVNSVVLVFIYGAIAFFVYQLTKEFPVQMDLSANASFRLSPEMQKVLAEVDAQETPIRITAFTAQSSRTDAGQRNRLVRDILGQIAKYSTSVEWQMIDFDQERLTAQQLGVKEYGQIVLQRGDKRVDIKERDLFGRVQNNAVSELNFYGQDELVIAMNSLLLDLEYHAYVTVGHQELSLFQAEGTGLSSFHKMLELQNIQVHNINLLTMATVPLNATILIIPQPVDNLTSKEVALVQEALERGVSLLFASKTGQDELLQTLGLQRIEGIVVEEKSQFPYWDRPIVSSALRQHLITEDILQTDISIVFSRSSAFVAKDTTVTPLIALSSRGWIDRGGVMENGRPVLEPAIDYTGEAYLGLALEREHSRIVVLGDMDWANNAMVADLSGNSVLMNNMLRWLLQQDKRLEHRTFIKNTEMLITKPQLEGVRWIAVLLLPSCISLLGVVVWYRRQYGR